MKQQLQNKFESKMYFKIRKVTIANLITSFRLFLVFPSIYYLVNEKYIPCAVFMMLFLFLDMLDGFLARTFKAETKLGVFLDPTVDKLFILPLFLLMFLMNLIPIYLLMIIFLREILMSLGLVFFLLKKQEVIPSRFTGKLTIFVYTISASLTLLNFKHTELLHLITSAIVILSMTDYSFFGITKLSQKTTSIHKK